MSYAEQTIESAAFEHGLSLPTVRTMAHLCEQLQAEHGDTWTEQHLADLVDAGVTAREPYALEFVSLSMADAFRPLPVSTAAADVTRLPNAVRGES
jgi:hypothetical protein